jgi:phosphoribosylaminoimidazole (AIR) synthetase
VDIEAGYALVQRIKPLARGTDRDGVLGSIGSFGGMFRLNDVSVLENAIMLKPLIIVVNPFFSP